MPGKKSNKAKKKWRERWYLKHPGLTHKEYSKQKKSAKKTSKQNEEEPKTKVDR